MNIVFSILENRFKFNISLTDKILKHFWFAIKIQFTIREYLFEKFCTFRIVLYCFFFSKYSESNLAYHLASLPYFNSFIIYFQITSFSIDLIKFFRSRIAKNIFSLKLRSGFL